VRGNRLGRLKRIVEQGAGDGTCTLEEVISCREFDPEGGAQHATGGAT
jgi:hypothetical protein